MLEFLRRSSTSVFAWLILGLLALAFGLSFGLPSDSLTFGPGALVEVHGEKIGEQDYVFQQNLVASVIRTPEDQRFAQLMGFKEEVLEGAVEREVLAEAADDLGLATTQRDAEDLVADGHMIVFGDTFDWLGSLSFDYEIFTKSFLRNLRVSEKDYLETQRKELLARTVRDLIASSVAISEAELRAEYEAQANKLSLRYARYPFADFADLYDPSSEEIEGWTKEHRAELEQAYASQGSRFTKLPEQARVWVIAVPKEDADAKATLEQARKTIEGGEDFRTVARRLSEHDSAVRGGDYGWVSVGSGSGLDPVVDEALAELQPDQLSPVLEGEDNLWLVRVSGKREGDVALEGALPELAEEAIKADKAKQLAKQAAEADLAAVKEGKPLGKVFEGAGALGETGDTPIEELDTETGQAAGSDYEAELRETGLFGKGEPIPGLGPQPALVDRAWEAGTEKELLDEVFEVPDAYVLAGLAQKETANDDSFAQMREELYDRAVERKGGLVAARWAKRRCLEAKGKGDISAVDDKLARILTYDVPDQKEPPEGLQPYAVCDRVGNRGGLLRAGLFGRGGG